LITNFEYVRAFKKITYVRLVYLPHANIRTKLILVSMDIRIYNCVGSHWSFSSDQWTYCTHNPLFLP